MNPRTIRAGRPKLSLPFRGTHTSPRCDSPRPLNLSGEELRRIIAERIG